MTAARPTRPARTRTGLAVLSIALVGVLVAAGELEARAPRAAPTAVVGATPVGEADVVGCRREDDDGSVAQRRDEWVAGSPVRSVDVLACPPAYDGLAVTYVGEVVGDVLARRGGAWLRVNDDPYALEVGPLTAARARRGPNQGLAVWVPTASVGLLGEPGRATRRGDVIAITGIVRRDDPRDGGGLTLTATALEVVAASTPTPAPVDATLATIAAAVVATTGLGLALDRRRRPR